MGKEDLERKFNSSRKKFSISKNEYGSQTELYYQIEENIDFINSIQGNNKQLFNLIKDEYLDKQELKETIILKTPEKKFISKTKKKLRNDLFDNNFDSDKSNLNLSESMNIVEKNQKDINNKIGNIILKQNMINSLNDNTNLIDFDNLSKNFIGKNKDIEDNPTYILQDKIINRNKFSPYKSIQINNCNKINNLKSNIKKDSNFIIRYSSNSKNPKSDDENYEMNQIEKHPIKILKNDIKIKNINFNIIRKKKINNNNYIDKKNTIIQKSKTSDNNPKIKQNIKSRELSTKYPNLNNVNFSFSNRKNILLKMLNTNFFH